MGQFDNFIALQQGGCNQDAPTQEIFKCKDCGAETMPAAGWNGEPAVGHCHKDCPSHNKDWLPGRRNQAYRDGIDRIWPNAPGAGL
jgi:hypothetical protein